MNPSFKLLDKKYVADYKGISKAFEDIIAKIAQFRVLTKDAKKRVEKAIEEFYLWIQQLVKYPDSYNVSEDELKDLLKKIKILKERCLKEINFKIY